MHLGVKHINPNHFVGSETTPPEVEAIFGRPLLAFVPAVTHLSGDARVAGFAQRHEVGLVMSAALREWTDVVNLLCFSEPATLEAFLTQRVCLDVTVPDAFPSSAVPTAASRIALVLLISLGLLFGVFLAETLVSQPGTAGERARSLGSLGH